jgi:hypothetical protein
LISTSMESSMASNLTEACRPVGPWRGMIGTAAGV